MSGGTSAAPQLAKPLRPVPTFQPLDGNLALVDVLDQIRFGPLRERDEYGEFTWFAREYPRIYRHHVGHAEYRLAAMVRCYEAYHAEAAETLRQRRTGRGIHYVRRPWTRGGPTEPPSTYALYWDFESYLGALSSALDVAARVAGTAYAQVTPPSFTRFCKSAPEDDLRAVFVRARERWVLRLKEYRDCFVHYTSVDTVLLVGLVERETHYEIRARLPVNPEAREILAFRYARRVELLSYALTVWRHFLAFDRAVARHIWRRYRAGTYPVRIHHLFFVGARVRAPRAAEARSPTGAEGTPRANGERT